MAHTWNVITWTHFPHHWPFVLGIHWLPMNSQYYVELWWLLFSRHDKWFWTNSRVIWDTLFAAILMENRSFYMLPSTMNGHEFDDRWIVYLWIIYLKIHTIFCNRQKLKSYVMTPSGSLSLQMQHSLAQQRIDLTIATFTGTITINCLQKNLSKQCKVLLARFYKSAIRQTFAGRKMIWNLDC